VRSARLFALLASSAALVTLCVQGCDSSSSGDCAERATCGDATAGRDVGGGSEGGGGDGGGGDDSPDVALTGDVFDEPDATSGAETGADVGVDAESDEAGDAGADSSDSAAVIDTGAPDQGPPPSCVGGQTCVDPVPGGWAGPLALFVDVNPGGPPPQPAPCPPTYPMDVYDGVGLPTQPQDQCNCTCATSTGGKCGSTTVTIYTNSSCTTSCGNATDPTSCAYLNNCAGYTGTYAIVPATPVADAGSCKPSQTIVQPAWGWTQTSRTCQTMTLGGACGTGGVCVNVPPSPFLPKVCLAQSGDVPCPGGTYSSKNVFYQGGNHVDDARGCSACTCQTPNTKCLGTAMTVFDVGTGPCDYTSYYNLVVDGGCQPLYTLSPYYVLESPPYVSPGSCQPTGGQPVGQITPLGPTTVCCQP